MSKNSHQKIVVFEEKGSGDYKIAGIEVYGKNIDIVKTVNIEEGLPEVIDEPEEYISDAFEADLVLNFLKHPDLSEYLVKICNKKGIPCIASGQHIPGAICPFTCCGLGRKEGLGCYGEQFGFPEYKARITLDDKIEGLEVIRAASCGATYQVVKDMIGVPVNEAPTLIARLVQYVCLADPSDFDPVTGKSALHFAGHVHKKALEMAILAAKRDKKDGSC